MSIPIDSNGDTSFWYKETVEICKHLGIAMISESPHKFHFRFWATDNRIIDVWKGADNSHHASVAFWAVKCHNGRIQRRLYYQFRDLDSATAERLASSIYTSDIKSIPTDYSIKRWNEYKVLGGICYNIEIAEDDHYSFKEYDNPRNRENIPDARTIQNFIDTLDKQLNIDTLWDSFYKSIPFKYPLIAGYISLNNKGSHQKFNVLVEKRKTNKNNRNNAIELKPHEKNRSQ